jgi:hypothetical protein
VVTAVDKRLPTFVSFALCVIAGVLALIFVLLDRRNRDLVWLGEDVLVELERKNFFGENQSFQNREQTAVPFGILWRQAREDNRRGVGLWNDAWLGKHRFWLRAVGCLFAIAFFAAAILVLLGSPKELSACLI